MYRCVVRASAREQLPEAPFRSLWLDVPSFDSGLHHHESWELTRIEEGAGLMIIGSAVCPYGPGDIVLIAPDVPHCWLSAEDRVGPSRARVVGFSAVVAELIQQLPDGDDVRQLMREAEFGALACEAPQQLGSVLTTVARSSDLFALLERLPEAKWRRLPTRPELTADPVERKRIERVYTYVSDHAGGSVTLSGAARAANVAPQSFSRFFRRTTGGTFRAFVIDVRLSRACSLLRETDLAISTIAFQAGFANLANFNRRFRDRFGVTPSRYRRAQRSAVTAL